MAKSRKKKKSASKKPKSSRKKSRKASRQSVRKTRRKSAKSARRKSVKGIAGAASVVMDTIKGTDALRNKLEPPATSETE